MEHPYTFIGSLLHVDHEGMHIATAIFVSTILLLVALFTYPRLRKASANVVPDGRFGLRNVFEVLLDTLASLCDDIIGHGGRKHLPFIASIFFFILACNLIGLVPGFLPATENWATGAAVASIVFIAFNYYGFREHGVGYLKHFVAPISLAGVKNIALWVALMIPLIAFQALIASIELISVFLRPITLSIRLFVNITADHTVAGIFGGIFPYLLPLPFLILGLLVAFLQAFIFTLLTTVYISLAVAHEH